MAWGGGPYNKDPTIFAAVLLELCRSAERGRKLLCRGVWSELCGSVCLAESVVGAAEFVEASFRTASDVKADCFGEWRFLVVSDPERRQSGQAKRESVEGA